MKLSLLASFMPLAAALPAGTIVLDDELAARRVNVTERMATLEDRQASVSVDQRFKTKGKVYFGVATDQGLLTTGKNAAIVKANFGQVTPENSMKWSSLENTRGQYNWAPADYLVSNGMYKLPAR
jgi:endo-1,4-beta-xylanase